MLQLLPGADPGREWAWLSCCQEADLAVTDAAAMVPPHSRWAAAGVAATAGSYVKGTADGIENLSNRAAEGVKGTLGETVRVPLFAPCRASEQSTFAPF